MSDSPADIELEVRQLRERVRLLEALLRHSRDLLFCVDAHGRIQSLNDAAERAIGYSEHELVGRPFDDLIAPASLANATQFPAALTTRSGVRIPVEIRRERRIVVATDLGERKALEENARQAQRMETLGLLAGGIAHDFNNLLTGILGHAYLMQTDPGVSKDHIEALEVIIRSSERAAQLTTQLLGFARGKKTHLAPVDLHHIIQDIAKLLRRTIDKKVRITTDLTATECHVVGDASQMYQVLLNLCLNARDAMPDGGEIGIVTKNAGRSIVISVSDTGTGIPEDIRDHIFEAFFTTKGSERGTGMGLATVKAIVRNHGGAINLETEVDEGAVFHITLPVSAPAQSPVTRVALHSHRASGTILVIEDEACVRHVLEQMLRGFGYDVVCSKDVIWGIEYFREHATQIDLVILDLVMPALNGIECLEMMRAMAPEVKVVLTSGSGNGEVPGVEYLPKPYQPEQLAEVVRRALHAHVAAASAD
ncbi:MAG TPA: ATP-binding protein [Bryobacteraceae bacterium]|nr:ATP-binding protein [Bryobacteraceae bacterium]